MRLQGAFVIDLGWTRTQPFYPGVYFESDEAGFPPVFTQDDLLTSSQVAGSPAGHVGGVYYPKQVIIIDKSAASPHASLLWAAFVCGVAVLWTLM